MQIDAEVANIIARWSLKEKVGQLFILAFPGKSAETIRPLITEYNLGGCYLSQDNSDTFEEAQRLTRALTEIGAELGRLPLLLGVDQEGAWGVLVGESTTGPGNLALGVAEQGQNTERMYGVMAEEMRLAGFNCILGPCCDVNFNPRSPIIDSRSFGDQPARVALHSAAAVRGLHGGGICGSGKHFPGHGDTQGDSHREIPRVDKSLAELREQDLLPFQAAIDAGVELIMTSHILYPQIDSERPATLSPVILQDLLRTEMGFEGIIISDSMNMGAIVHHYSPSTAAVLALKAGVNMIMLSEEHYDHSDGYLDKQLAMIHGVMAAVATGELDEALIDAALARIVAFKLTRLVPMALYGGVDIPAHQRVARECAGAALTWLRQVPVLGNAPLYVLNATPAASYRNLTNPRGIGPNQREPAYDHFIAALNPVQQGGREVGLDELNCLGEGWLVLVTENHPLPGEDFEQQEAQALVRRLSCEIDRLIVVALRSPYDLLGYPEVRYYLCSHSARPESARAAAEVLLGRLETQQSRAVSLVS
ncbi:glycoside hydrolase family 3 protein [Aeromonas taiwanensis]|uniref:glycoside hydrolase family 3 protein n=1 Tax=Aeromonas taiwanensis TaxID=633417 RepID=UPI00248E58C8|nr:glycoside hydrolase family 3 N-terminal domain-containing protein [Aeromonas taiwanensis]